MHSLFKSFGFNLFFYGLFNSLRLNVTNTIEQSEWTQEAPGLNSIIDSS
jgi:hypothetical protein